MGILQNMPTRSPPNQRYTAQYGVKASCSPIQVLGFYSFIKQGRGLASNRRLAVRILKSPRLPSHSSSEQYHADRSRKRVLEVGRKMTGKIAGGRLGEDDGCKVEDEPMTRACVQPLVTMSYVSISSEESGLDRH